MEDPGVQALILDFDGLIVDTETPIFEIWRAIYREHGQVLLLSEWQTALGTDGGFNPVDRLSELLGRAVDGRSLQQHAGQQHWEACRHQPLLPGVRALLTDARGLNLKLAVASSSPRRWVETWLGQHGILGWFDSVCVREDVAVVKPAPDLFLLAAQRLGAAPARCVVFEDSPNGVLAAHSAGMRCVAVRNALTRPITLPDPDLTLDSLEQAPLAEILRQLRPAPDQRLDMARPLGAQ